MLKKCKKNLFFALLLSLGLFSINNMAIAASTNNNIDTNSTMQKVSDHSTTASQKITHTVSNLKSDAQSYANDTKAKTDSIFKKIKNFFNSFIDKIKTMMGIKNS